MDAAGLFTVGVVKVMMGTPGAPEAHGMKLYWVPGVNPLSATEWFTAQASFTVVHPPPAG
jgi:hypothetical protein